MYYAPHRLGDPMPTFPKLRTHIRWLLPGAALALSAGAAPAQTPQRGSPADTEVWKPVPNVVTPGATDSEPPSDAIVLFDGTNLDEWVTVKDKSPAGWSVADGVMTVNIRRSASATSGCASCEPGVYERIFRITRGYDQIDAETA